MSLKNLFDKVFPSFKRKREFKKLFEPLEECSYFVRGYKCSCDANPCEFAISGSEGNMDISKAKLGKKTCKKHGGCYKPYYRTFSEFNTEDEKFYESLTIEQREILDQFRQNALR